MEDGQATMTDVSEQLEALSNLLTQLESSPYDISLHAQHIQLSTQLGMNENEAREMFTRFWPAGDDVWLPMIEHRIKDGINSVNEAKAVLELFTVAEFDFSSIPLLRRHAEFLIQIHEQFSENEDSADLFTTTWTSTMLAAVSDKATGHISQSHLVWDTWRDWELGRLESAQGPERDELISQIDNMFLKRMRQPHSNHEETFQHYSSFTTNYKPASEYESLLVSASKSKSQAVKAWQRRETYESQLARSGYSDEAYDAYIVFETKPKKPDVNLVKMLYERAIADAAKHRFTGTAGAEVRLRSLWLAYCNFVRQHSESDEIGLLQRACRTVPGCGMIWANHIRAVEISEADSPLLTTKVVELCTKALETGLLNQQVDDIVEFVQAWAGQIMRTVQAAEGEEGVDLLFKVLEDGINLIRAASKQGDPRYRLEQLLSHIYEDLADSLDLATTVWESAAKHYKNSYLAWIKYAEALKKQQRYDDVRTVYRDIAFKNIDWPEAMFDSWLTFEHMYGTVRSIQDCIDRTERAQKIAYARRMKEAAAVAPQNVQPTTSQPDVPSTSTDVVMQEVDQVIAESSDGVVSVSASNKRKSESVEEGQSKKTKFDKAATSLKRDRENCTVFVSNLPQGAAEDDLNALFKDCGTIREIKLTHVNSATTVATVEFHDRESVPAALTKDKKRIQGSSISVHLAWRSTLYITNFPENMDDGAMRELFSKFGEIFDVRWPSKKFKSSRRFCYVQFTLPDHAQAALSLHQTELAPGRLLSVLISDPERRKERTDADADAREVHVAGLSKFATKDDLMKLFSAFGAVKDIRLATNEKGQAKGFAFVEFEDEESAQKALQANNSDLKNRRIAVTLADSRVRPKRNPEAGGSGQSHKVLAKERSVRIKGLGPQAKDQEGVLQQLLEKIVPIKRVEILADEGEAVVELESVADAGRLILHAEPIIFQGNQLQLTEERVLNATISKPRAAAFIPRAASARQRPGLGVKPKTTHTPTTQGGKGQDDFRKMLGLT